jgi:hypothetical protein
VAVVDKLYPSLDFAATAGLYHESIRAFYNDAEEQLQKLVKRHTNSEIQPELSVELGNAPRIRFFPLQKPEIPT